MTFKVKVDRKIKNLLKGKSKDGLIKQVRKEFGRRGPTKVKQAIIQDMIRGISPVKGASKYEPYSESYKKEILKGTSRRMLDASPKKSKSPVNLRLSGKLHRSLQSFLKGSALIIQFNNFLADIHNRLGAGKSKIIRRILPTQNGEQFNRRINKVILSQLQKAADVIAKQFSGQ